MVKTPWVSGFDFPLNQSSDNNQHNSYLVFTSCLMGMGNFKMMEQLWGLRNNCVLIVPFNLTGLTGSSIP
jgi:hypothetical protein